MSGIKRIEKERQRQIDLEGWTPEHDDAYTEAQLSMAAACYTLVAWDLISGFNSFEEIERFPEAPPDWPWDIKWWKPSRDPARNLEKAGALIAAEIDRLERKKSESISRNNP